MSTARTPTASVLIPAHQEESVIGRCLDGLLTGARPGEFEVVVVANGCTDGTGRVVKGYGAEVRLIELEAGSKTAALNAGDEVLRTFPRVYLDADVVVTAESLRAVAACLDSEHPLIATPVRDLQLEHSTVPVAWFLRTWEALQRARQETIGTGVYALNEAGRGRFDTFPDVVGDDRFVHGLFQARERRAVTPSVKVWPPATLRELIGVRTRVVVGNMTAGARVRQASERPSPYEQVGSLLRDPLAVSGLPLYLAVTLLVRWRARQRVRRGDLSWSRAQRRAA
ncbi:glycosyltransferase family 2 protein [Blastococcus sp. TBT05-19]|uniref:glycosyltransferase n=1 Tax=Blastococcus sp. TBT05-19 TaxID=2250581 RepID=UPI001314AF76|nr:glycosyltransferase [Blastococcus sp. TBT05-19]